MTLSIDVTDLVSIAKLNEASGGHQQVYCNTETAKVIDPQDTTNYISAQVIEHEDLPYGVPIGVQEGR